MKYLNSQLATTIEEQKCTAKLLRESETQVRLSNVELERRVAERTAQLVAANAQLTEALLRGARAQEALAKSEEEFRVSFEASAVGKTQSDPETGRIMRVNRAFADMLGYEAEDIVSHVGWEFTWPDDREAEKADYARVLASGSGVYIREKRYIRKDGTPIWGRVSSNIVQ